MMKRVVDGTLAIRYRIAVLSLENLARRFVPRKYHHLVLSFYYRAIAPLVARVQRGDARCCPLCESELKSFERLGARREGRCPVCGSLRRHRLVWLYMKQRTNLLDGQRRRILHVAPEPPVSRALEQIPGLDYLKADLDSPFAEVKMDITAIDYPDASFDVIYCSHVLEHVEEDEVAVRELFRVLRPGGWAILQVPIRGKVTRCDLSISTPEARKRAYGHPGHVRQYGRDFRKLLRGAGFQVRVDGFATELGQEATEYFGVDNNEKIYFCRKS